MFKARDAITRQRQFPLGLPVFICALYLLFIDIFHDVARIETDAWLKQNVSWCSVLIALEKPVTSAEALIQLFSRNSNQLTEQRDLFYYIIVHSCSDRQRLQAYSNTRDPHYTTNHTSSSAHQQHIASHVREQRHAWDLAATVAASITPDQECVSHGISLNSGYNRATHDDVKNMPWCHRSRFKWPDHL